MTLSSSISSGMKTGCGFPSSPAADVADAAAASSFMLFRCGVERPARPESSPLVVPDAAPVLTLRLGYLPRSTSLVQHVKAVNSLLTAATSPDRRHTMAGLEHCTM